MHHYAISISPVLEKIPITRAPGSNGLDFYYLVLGMGVGIGKDLQFFCVDPDNNQFVTVPAEECQLASAEAQIESQKKLMARQQNTANRIVVPKQEIVLGR